MRKRLENQQGFGTIEATLVVIVVVLLGIVGYIVYEKHNKISSNSTAAITPVTTMPAQSADSYAGWKTFTSNVGKFSLKYPADWSYADTTVGSNENQAFSLQSPDKNYGSFYLAFDILKASQSPSSPYPVDTNIQALTNGLRVWTNKIQWTSKSYNNFQPFDCARLRLLDKSTNKNVALPASEYLSSDGGFCYNEDTYTTKSYQEQLASQEYQDAIKIYSSIKINN